MGRRVLKPARLLERVKNLWVTRSLVVGAVSTVLDLGLGGLLLWLGAPTRWAAMAGTLAGSVFSYFAQRAFAFRDQEPMRRTLPRYALVAVTASTVHGQVVVWLSGWGLPYVAAKLTADVLVYSVGQMLLLRYVVFPLKRASTPPSQPIATSPPHG